MALIIDAPMPPSCRWHNTNGFVETCPYLQSCYAEFNFDDCRPSDCPIIGEIPDKHGRIIDEKWVELYFGKYLPIEFRNDMEKVYKLLELALEDVPTILEATE